MIYKTRNGQTIFDLAINTIADLNNIYDLITSNPTIENIESVPIGIEVNYAPPPSIPLIVDSLEPLPPITSANYYSRNNQTIYDVALQTYGDLNMVYKLMKDSNFSGLLSYPLPLTLFKFNPQLVSDNTFASYLSQNNLVIVTGDSERSQQVPEYLTTDDGIGLQTDDGTQIEID